MVSINGDDVKADPCSFITYCPQRGGGRQSYEYIPDEMWFEILSRLPIKSLFISRSVCKLWRHFFFRLLKKIDSNPLNVPLCGLLLVSHCLLGYQTRNNHWHSYFCLRKKENFIITRESPENNSIYSSGFEKGLLSDVTFDFSIIHKVIPGTDERRFISFVLHGGLLLLTLNDCTSQVHNPATKQIYFVPRSKILEKYGFYYHARGEKRGLIIQFPSYLTAKRCHFIVVRFCVHIRIMEVYNSVTHRWSRYRLDLDDEVLSPVWHLQGYAGFFENGVLSLYVPTKKGCGIAIKFPGRMKSEMKQYCFPLPEVIC